MNENKCSLQLLSSQLSYENIKKVEVMDVYHLCLSSNCPQMPCLLITVYPIWLLTELSDLM